MVKKSWFEIYGRPNFNLLNNAVLHESLAPGCLGDQIWKVAPTFCLFWVWNLLHVILVALRMLRWLLDFLDTSRIPGIMRKCIIWGKE